MCGTNMQAGMIALRTTKTRKNVRKKRRIHQPATGVIIMAPGTGLRKQETPHTILPPEPEKQWALQEQDGVALQ